MEERGGCGGGKSGRLSRIGPKTLRRMWMAAEGLVGRTGCLVDGIGFSDLGGIFGGGFWSRIKGRVQCRGG